MKKPLHEIMDRFMPANHSRMRFGHLSKLFACVLVIGWVAVPLSLLWAQENAGKGLPALIHGNERLGRNLLLHEHAGSPERNVVLAPLPITMSLAAMQTFGWSEDLGKQLNSELDWQRGLRLNLPMRQLLALFEVPKPVPCNPKAQALAKKKFGIKMACPKGIPDGAWVTNTLLYRSGPEIGEAIPEYVREGMEKDFAFTFVDTGKKRPSADNLPNSHNVAELPKAFSQPSPEKPDDVWINSGMHLKTRWRGNTFSMSTPYPGEFQAFSGLPRKISFLNSELELYYHAKNSMFEAATLPADDAYMVIVMPEKGVSIRQLEEELSAHPEALDAALERQVGIVTMPVFQMTYDSDVSQSIKAMGIVQPFQDLGSITGIPKSHLTRIGQKVEIQVDKDGIRANAETVSGIVYGGILSAKEPFHMVVDRPFVFLIRDQTTNALLFIGALMDPKETPTIAVVK
jgi:hypothetical protein